MATKSKGLVKLKSIGSRNDEKKLGGSIIGKIPPIQTNDQQKLKSATHKTSEFSRLINGDFTQDFTKQTSRLFRIFLSSTFSDFKVERNELYRRVFPPIKQKCAQLGYEFQVVDMRWGVSDTADIDHTADVICMDEIERCMDLSAGLNFIYLIGNRYGYMYVPLEIDEVEFETIIQVAYQEKIDNVNLIEKWFQLDKNSLPPKYVYVPVTTYFKNFEQSSIDQLSEKKQWQSEEKSLLKALRDSVDKAFQLKKLSSQQAIKYFQSITEREIRRATVEKNRSNVIGVIREFSNPYVETSADAKFFDSSRNERITDSINQLKSYCTRITPVSQLKKFTVPWKSGGLNLIENTSHQQYIDDLCEYLTLTILKLIESTCRKLSNKTLSPLYEDLLHHATFCQEKTKFFFGREELLSNVHSRIELNRRNTGTPIAFVAESGCGKTSFMARLATELRIWYPSSAVFIRFLGTSARSTTIESVIRSLCQQLKLLYGDDSGNQDDESLTFSALVRIFYERLKSITRKRAKILSRQNRPKPLFILLDAIDQLEDTSKYSFYFESWLLRYLPRDVHIFLSFIPTIERYNIKDLFLQFIRNDETTLFTVPRLRPNDCEDIIRSSLEISNRQLTYDQYTYLLTTVIQNPKPLYLKLLLDIARRWTCFTVESLKTKLILPETIEEAVEQLFARLENRHGKEFVQYSLAYLVYGLNGISEIELEDCLSINDIVLNEVYDHHDPPIPKAVHVPSLLCQSLLYSIKEYISRKRIHDKHILSFYHRKFSESTRKRYKHLREQCHEHLIELYCHDQPSYKKSITLNKRNNKTIEDADRLINTQLTNILNKRKLIALPYHCLEYGPGKDDLLRTSCLFNLEFLSCQLKSLGHTIFLDSLRYCLRLRPSWQDLKRLYRSIWSIDDKLIENSDPSLVLSEQILGFIDDRYTSQVYNQENTNNQTDNLEKLITTCRAYCNTSNNYFRSLYAGFPQETGALAWSFSPVTHVLYTNEFFTLVIINGVTNEDEKHFIFTYTVALINLQTGKIDKIDLDETFNEIWKGHITKNGHKIYLFGRKFVRKFNSRTGDLLKERELSWDKKSFCNKAYCITTDEEQLIVANQWRIIAMDEIDEDSIYRSGRIPTKFPMYKIENNENVEVHLRCIGINDNYVLCLIFDEEKHVLLTLWSLNEHEEMLPMRFALFHQQITSPNLFDLPLNSNDILYLATCDGHIRIFDLLKVKINQKIQPLYFDETIQQIHLSLNTELQRLVCLTDDILVVSTVEFINLYNRKNISNLLQRINLTQVLLNWNMINQDDHNRILVTVDTTQKNITIYRTENTSSSSLNEIKIAFRSNVLFTQLIQTTTIMDNDEKKKTYILIVLQDQTIQLLDTNQISQSSLQPYGLFTRIKHHHLSNTCVVACQYDSPSPLVLGNLNQQYQTPKLLTAFNKQNIDFISMLNNDQYYVLISNNKLVYIYSVENFMKSLFQYDLNTKVGLNLFSLQTYDLNIIIFMFMSEFVVLKVNFDIIENKFNLESQQTFSIANQLNKYTLEFSKTKRFLIFKQLINAENDPNLYEIRFYTCDERLKISPLSQSITFAKTKVTSSSKINGFRTYLLLDNRSELWLAHQGTILRARLPSNVAEIILLSDYHCWMRHSLALYQQTTKKTSLSTNITRLASQISNNSCIASGGDDGSIIIWNLTNKCNHVVLESIHIDEITDLKFDPNTNRLFSSSLDRTLAVWSPTILLHFLRVHIPINKLNIFPLTNILSAYGEFWGFDRLMMFSIGNSSNQEDSSQKINNRKDNEKSSNVEASEIASWAL